MEQEKKAFEEKKLQDGQPQNGNGQGGGQGGRRRKKHRKRGSQGGNGQNGQNGQAVQQQSVQANGQTQQTPQNNQNGQNNRQNGGKGQANKPQNAQKQQQNQPKNDRKQQQKQRDKNQNGGGRDKTSSKNDAQNNRKDTYAYVLDDNLYINLTNKCSNACDFCVRNERDSYFGHYLWIRQGDPTPEKVIAQVNALGDIARFKEAVFCGFGEPTYKVAEMVALCDFFHEKGLKTRLNTNGQGNLINKRDIVPDLVGKIDLVNVSLNASCYEKYQPICRSQFGENGFSGMIEFAKSCKRAGVNCRFSIVDCIGKEEVEACKRLAESVRVPLLVREYITES